jgi:O-antigen ligase
MSDDAVCRGRTKAILKAGMDRKITEAEQRPAVSGLALVLSAWHDPAARVLNVDLATVLIALLLPWSTTGVVIAAALWIVALVPTLETGALLRSLKRPISALPIAIFGLALVGILWSDASWGERLHGIGPTARLLVLPLLLYHCERSPRGVWVFIAFLVSCVLLMLASWLVAFDPDLSLKLYFSRGAYGPTSGIAVKNYIDQSQEFMLCAVALAYPVLTLPGAKRIWPTALLAAVALSFLVNMMFVVVSRTALVTMPVMLAVFALVHLRLRTAIVTLAAAAVLAGLVWNVSPHLRATVSKFSTDYQYTADLNNETGIGSRLLYWQKSLRFFGESPLIGHGTGATRGLFQRAAIGEDGARAQVVSNPHNQTLNMAVQWGVIGVALLYAMWLAHLLLFRGEGLAAWVGLLVVVQNISTSLFNSHLFDFQEGWIYVLGVGVAGGMVLRARRIDAGNKKSVHAQTAPYQTCAGQK